MSSHAILNSDVHRDLRIITEPRLDLGDSVMSAVTVPTEFRKIQNEYPILFKPNPERDGFTALALFGFEPGENLFFEDARWDARYRPLTMELQPFLIGAGPEGSDVIQVHIDMASLRISYDEGIRVFDQTGSETPFLDAVSERLDALDVGYHASHDFFAALRRHDLLEPLTLNVTLDDGSTNRLVGFHVIDEERLRALDTSALAELHHDNHLIAIFMALASLSNFTALIARKNRRLALR